MARNSKSKKEDYALSGRIMLIAIVVLFIVIIIMLCLHVYVRWRLVRARRQQHLRRSNRPQFVFYMDPAASIALTRRGLHPSVISTLPVFTFSPATTNPTECAVCLSEFEDGETGRVLPKCNHSFHTECIDMWFQSHATCPLCRAAVEAQPEARPDETVIACEPEPVRDEVDRSGPVGESSSALRVEVVGRNESFGRESGCESGSSFRSPVSRMLSFKSILGREKKGSVSGCVVGGCSSMTELDAERAGRV
ncbi:RING-H2 finger protein ATL2 [Spatholobus suberectus]|nr:RING-H2 finger protein ATL2 [Spatholobus suberectus]